MNFNVLVNVLIFGLEKKGGIYQGKYMCVVGLIVGDICVGFDKDKYKFKIIKIVNE